MKESGEMYLETILLLKQDMPEVRSIDVAERMGFSKPSVSRAISKLRQDECISVDKNGFLTLTEKGQGIAEMIYERHVVLSGLLMRLGVSEATALQDACRIEHDISDETFRAIKAHAEKNKGK